jgi:hypothetical protein
VAWAARFIVRSAVETESGRRYCLFDDAMVSLRYAWNFAHGDGLAWNPGERVEGITSFLFTLVMSLGAFLFDKSGAALFVQILGIPLVLGVALLVYRLGRALDMTRVLALVPFAAALAYYPLSYWSLMGMETGLLAALSAAALFVALRLGSEPAGGKLLGLLLGSMFATRPDAAVPAIVILGFRAVWVLRRHRRWEILRPWLLEVSIFVGVVVGLTLFRWAYYGSPVPNTYALKMANWPLSSRIRNGWHFVVPFLDTSRYLLGLSLAAVTLHRDGRRLLLFCFGGSVVICQIWVGGDAWAYWRMLVPGVVAFVVLAADGAGALIRSALRRESRALVLGASLACSAVAIGSADRPFAEELRMEVPAYMVSFNQSAVEAGIELSRIADPKGSVAVAAAGTVPYYSGLRGVDVLGKSDRTIARLRGLGVDDGSTITPGHNKLDLHYSIETLRPDAIYDAVSWSRHDPKSHVFEFVQAHYVSKGSFWLRRDSPYVYWDRVR